MMGRIGHGFTFMGVALGFILLGGVIGCATSPGGIEAQIQGRSSVVTEHTVVRTRDLIAPDDVVLEDEEAEGFGADAVPVDESQLVSVAGDEGPGEADWWSEVDLPEYRIAPGDVLSFQSFDDPEISNPQLVVRYDGFVSLPFIDDINLRGLTRNEAASEILEAYEQVFVDEPKLSLTILNAQGQHYYVMGDVQAPRQYPYTQPYTVLQALNIAGGRRERGRTAGTGDLATEVFTSDIASLKKAFIIRHFDGDRHIVECDLTGLVEPGPHPSDFTVWPDDVIYVPPGVDLVYLMGAVARPSVFNLQEGESLMQLLARAGGVVETTARLRKVIIIRPISDNESEVFTVDVRQMYRGLGDVRLEAGDIIYVPRKPLIRLQEFVGRFTGSITPLMNLYRQAFDTYYTKERYDRLFDDVDTGPANTLRVLETLRGFGNVFQTLPLAP